MDDLLVTVDLGNTRLKLAAWAPVAAPDAAPVGAVALGPDQEEPGIARWLEGLGGRPRCALSNVAGAVRGERVRALLAEALGAPPLEPHHGLENRCHTPASVGADRLFAARGALALLGGDCLVLDAGTALTVDAVRALPQAGDPGACPGAFLGGAIAPGPDLLARALAQGAAQLPDVRPEVDVRALGGDTAEAIRSGVAHGFRGAAAELARRVAAEAGLERAPLLVTGGARVFLLDPPGLFPSPPREADDLVHRGLRAALAAT